jgi:hypothetical protein
MELHRPRSLGHRTIIVALSARSGSRSSGEVLRHPAGTTSGAWSEPSSSVAGVWGATSRSSRRDELVVGHELAGREKWWRVGLYAGSSAVTGIVRGVASTTW